MQSKGDTFCSSAQVSEWYGWWFTIIRLFFIPKENFYFSKAIFYCPDFNFLQNTFASTKNEKAMDSDSVKKNIQKVRKEMGLTQKEMAEKLGISRTAYRNLEKGETRVYSDHITKMAELAGKEEEEVVLGFTPSQYDEDQLREISNYEQRLQALRDDYENKLSDLRDKLRSKDELIASLQSNVRALESMVDLLRK